MILDETSGLPLYHQLKDIIYNKIMSAEWSLGSQIPTEEEMVAEYKVSRSTVRSAIAELTRQGILSRKRGIGTFVVALNMDGYFVCDQGYPDKMDDSHENIAITSMLPDESVARLLKIDPSKPVFEFVRLMGKEELTIIEMNYIDQSLCPDLPDNPPTGKFYEWLGKKHHLDVHGWETILEATCFNEKESRLLGVEVGQSALLYKRLTTGAGGEPIYYSKSLFRGDRFCVSYSSATKGWITKIKL